MVCTAAGISSAGAAVLIFDFDDGTLQGWTLVTTGSYITRNDGTNRNQSEGIFRYDVVANSELLSDDNKPGRYRDSVTEAAQSGTYRILPTPFYDRDDNLASLGLRSPEFRLDGSGDVSAYLRGGVKGDDPPATDASLPETTSESGFKGIALRRVSDGKYVLSAGRTSDASNWEEVGFTQSELAPFVSPTETYTLDLIDSGDGNWGWVGMDTVSVAGVLAVPEPSSLFLFSLASLALIRRRRK